jgi:hypothetical protein
MACPALLLELLAYGESRGLREDIVGDLLEEIDSGRSRAWVCRQLIALVGFAVLAHLRSRARLTPRAVAVALGALWLAAVSMTSVGRALEAWLVLYYAAGMLSLFAHMASEGMARHHG